jgi:hypothetical protein
MTRWPGGGAQFFRQLAQSGSDSEVTLKAALWKLIWAGWVTCDTRAGQQLWVDDDVGERMTYWCPACQHRTGPGPGVRQEELCNGFRPVERARGGVNRDGVADTAAAAHLPTVERHQWIGGSMCFPDRNRARRMAGHATSPVGRALVLTEVGQTLLPDSGTAATVQAEHQADGIAGRHMQRVSPVHAAGTKRPGQISSAGRRDMPHTSDYTHRHYSKRQRSRVRHVVKLPTACASPRERAGDGLVARGIHDSCCNKRAKP